MLATPLTLREEKFAALMQRCAAAGLSAGSMPMTGMSEKAARSVPMAALVAVLQAMTAALMPRAYSRAMTLCVSSRTSAAGRTP